LNIVFLFWEKFSSFRFSSEDRNFTMNTLQLGIKWLERVGSLHH